ncbi:MAG: PEP-CTERM sorting domain-containing protein [Planctomycetota bacterium]
MTFTDVALRLRADLSADAAASLSGTGFPALIGDQSFDINESFAIDEEVVIPSLTLDGDELTLSSSLDLADFLDLDEFLPITEELLADSEIAALLQDEFADLVGLISDLELDADVDATASFSTTFVIPEPTSAALLGLSALAMLRRNVRSA